MKIAMVQFDALLLDVEGNQGKALHYIEQAKEEHADMVLFPEFFTTGFALDQTIVSFRYHRFLQRGKPDRYKCEV